MSIYEFDNQAWSSGMLAIYEGQTYHVSGCDFKERRVGLHHPVWSVIWVPYGLISGVWKEEQPTTNPRER